MAPRAPALAFCLAVAVALGCDGGGDSPSDGGTARDAADGAAEGIAPPAEPAMPELTPCPDGWHEVEGEAGAVVCEPWPESGRADCEGGEAHLPGHSGCAPLGASCPSGPWPADLPDDDVLYVQQGASGGDGTRAQPYGRIGDALGRARNGTVVAVAKGRYEEVLYLPAGVTVRGACAAETVLTTGVADDFDAVVETRAPDTGLQDLTVGEAPRPGINVFDGGQLRLQGVVVRDVMGVGFNVALDARLEARELAVRDVAPVPSGAGGRGLIVELQSEAHIEGASFERVTDNALSISNQSTVTLKSVAVADTASRVDGRTGRALSVRDGSAITARAVVLEGSGDLGAALAQDGTHGDFEDVVVRGTRGRPLDGREGRGLVVMLGARLEGRRLLLEDNGASGLFAVDPASDGPTVQLEDVVVRDTRGDGDGAFGRGLGVEPGAVVHLTRSLFARNRQVAVFVADEGAELTLEDATVVDTRSTEASGAGGEGLRVQEGGTLVARRARIEGNRGVGVVATRPGSRLELSDLIVAHTDSEPFDGHFGRALSVERGAGAQVERGRLEHSRNLGVFAGGDAELTMRDVVVRVVEPPACAEDGCADSAAMGIGSYENASVQVTSFRIEQVDLCGLQIATGGQIDAADGVVEGNPIGACIRDEGFDVDRLTDGVDFRDNEINLDSRAQPVPDPLPEL